MIKAERLNKNILKVYYSENNKYIGKFIMLEDGYYNYEPSNDIGLFSSYALKLISDKLEELNKTWDEKVKNDLSNTDI